MHVGEGNTNGTSSNKLQIVNGQINVDGSELVMHDNAVISMTGGYGDNAQPDISAGISVTNGGVVRNAEGTKINDFTMGNLFGEHGVTSTLSADGTSLILSKGASVRADSITIGEGASLSILSDDTAEAALVFGIDADEASLLTPVATIDADLILQDGALVTLNGGPIDMNGHSLTMGNNISITLSGDAYNSNDYVLFTNLGNTGTEDVEFELTVNGQKTTAVYSGNAVVVNAASVPEPTSATLSLLALAGLVMRRRRK